MANIHQLKEASRLLKEQFPTPLIKKTVDVYNGLSSIERQILFESTKIYPPRLMKINPR